VSFSQTECTVFTLNQPYLLVDTNTKQLGTNEITVTAWDKDTTKENAKISKFSIYLVINPLALIDVESDIKKEEPLQVVPGSVLEHKFPNSYIKRGNSLDYSVKYPEEAAKQYLQSEVKEYLNYLVKYDKEMTGAKP